MSHFVITANRLSDGVVIFQTGTGWSEDLAQAELLADKTEIPGALDRAAQAAGLAVGPYEVPVTLEGGLPTPVKYRERLRVSGPSIPYLKREAA